MLKQLYYIIFLGITQASSETMLTSWEGEWGQWEPWTFPDVENSTGYALRINNCHFNENKKLSGCEIKLKSRHKKIQCTDYETFVTINSPDQLSFHQEDKHLDVNCSFQMTKSEQAPRHIRLSYSGKCEGLCYGNLSLENEKAKEKADRPNPLFAQSYPFRSKAYLPTDLAIVQYRAPDLAMCYSSSSPSVKQWCENKQILSFESAIQEFLKKKSARCWNSKNTKACLPEREQEETSYLQWRAQLWQQCEQSSQVAECLISQMQSKLTAVSDAEDLQQKAILGKVGNLADAEKSADLIAGVYKVMLKHEMVSGASYNEENILELVKTEPGALYFKTKLFFENGHQCFLYGVAQYKDNGTFTLRKKEESSVCHMQIVISADKITFNDLEGLCQRLSCGARGSYDGIQFPLSKKRPIKYMKILENSSDFKESLETYSKDKL